MIENIIKADSNTDDIFEGQYEPDDTGIRKVIRKLKYPELTSFHVHYKDFFRDLQPSLHVSEKIGRQGSKILYQNKEFIVEWKYINKSGAHKDHGQIRYSSNGNLLAVFDITKSQAKKFTIKNPSFIEEVKCRGDIPYCDFIKSLFKGK